VDVGAAEMILNGELSGQTLAERIKSLANDKQALNLVRSRVKEFSRPDAAERVVNIVFELVFK
jgi:UDP-N-acetylglucosamine:LPS N-acetylglucosamine transferase